MAGFVMAREVGGCQSGILAEIPTSGLTLKGPKWCVREIRKPDITSATWKYQIYVSQYFCSCGVRTGHGVC